MKKDTEMFENRDFANLPFNETGIRGYIYISTKEGQHGARIKYLEKLGKENPSVSISISKIPKILVKSNELTIDDKTKEKIFEWVKKNKGKLMMFWKNGAYMARSKVEQLLDSLEPVE